MRIGIISGEYPPMQGGVGAYSSILAENFHRQGHYVAVMSSNGARSSDPAIPIMTANRWNPGTLLGIRQWAQNERLDLINLQYQTAAFGMSPFIHFIPDSVPIPTITTFHDLRYPYLFPKAGAVRRWIVNRLARMSAGAIATNHEDEIPLRALTTTALIPIGSNIRAPQPDATSRLRQRKQWGLGRDQFIIGYFGLMNHSKGLDILLTSLRALLDADIPALLLLIGGGLGSSDPTNAEFMRGFNAQIADLRLEQAILATGYLEADEAVAAGLTACDVIALPFADGASSRRGSLMAALQYGCPIVTTQPTVPIPVFDSGDCVRLIPRGDATALTAALRELYTQPTERERLGANARTAASAFDWEQIASAQVSFFERILQKAVRK